MTGLKVKVKVTQSCLTLCDPRLQSMEFSRPEYWSGQPFPSPGDLPNPGIKPRSPMLQVDSLPAELPGNSSIIRKKFQFKDFCLLRFYWQQILYLLKLTSLTTFNWDQITREFIFAYAYYIYNGNRFLSSFPCSSLMFQFGYTYQ